jgi:hypothetical protein
MTSVNKEYKFIPAQPEQPVQPEQSVHPEKKKE